MTDYSTDRSIRIPVVVSLAFLAILTASLLRDYLSDMFALASSQFGIVNIKAQTAEIINSLSATAIVFLYIRLFSGPVWQLVSRFTPRLIPNFSGMWHGYITERKFYEQVEYDADGEVFRKRVERMVPVQMEISQDFFRIGIMFRSEAESDVTTGRDSGCTMAQIDFEDLRNPQLKHTFQRADMVGEVRLTLNASGEQATLAGNYSSSKQRVGYMEMTKAKRGTTHRSVEVKALAGPAGQVLAALIDQKSIRKFGRRLRKCVGKRRYDLLNAARIAKSGNDYRLAVFDEVEWQALSETQRRQIEERLLDKTVWIELLEVRKHSEGALCTYFVAVESKVLDNARQQLGLATKELRIPLGCQPLRSPRLTASVPTRVTILRERLAR